MTTPDQSTTDDMVAEAALQLWSAAQTDFDPFEVDSSDWPETAVAVRDVDIAVDTHLEVDDVRGALERLDGVKVVVGREAGTLSVLRVVPEDTPLSSALSPGAPPGGRPAPPRSGQGRRARRAACDAASR